VRLNEISSAHNSQLKQIRAVQEKPGRQKSGLFLLEGEKAICEALAYGIKLQNVVASQSFWQRGLSQTLKQNLDELSLVEDKLLNDLATTQTPSGIVALAPIPQVTLESAFNALLAQSNQKQESPLIVVCSAIQDPGNLGTMIRTALAANAQLVICTKGTCDVYNPKTVRGASGALFKIPIVENVEYDLVINQLKEKGITTLACHQESQKPYWQADLTRACALVFGNEGQGFAESSLEACDEIIAIPMNKESESLNVAMACAIVLFAASEQRLRQRHG
jgi:TrmH family RNA methyltransferase